MCHLITSNLTRSHFMQSHTTHIIIYTNLNVSMFSSDYITDCGHVEKSAFGLRANHVFPEGTRHSTEF